MTPSRSFVVSLLLAGCSTLPGETALAPPSAAARVLSPGCAGSPYATIQSAIDDAVNNDVIEVCAGTWNERLSIVGKALTLRSVDGAAATTIDAQGAGRALTVSGGANALVEGFTFANGVGDDGGNLWCEDSDFELRDSVLRGGTATQGGGLFADTCVGLVRDNTFEDNLAWWSGGGVSIAGDDLDFVANIVQRNASTDQGGGLYVDGSARIEGNTFDDNTSNWGGGAFLNWSWSDVFGNIVTHNASVDDGGGIYVLEGSPLVEGNTFEDNVAEDEAGGLRLKLTSATVRENTFLRNHADYRGGAMKISHGASTVEGNEYLENSTWVSGGAVVLVDSGSTLRDELYRDNTAENGGGLAVIGGWAAVMVEDCVFDRNEAYEDGGHIYIDKPVQRTTLRRLTLVRGLADDGGGVYAVGSEVAIQNPLLAYNEATVSGGALYFDAVSGEVTNGVMFRNESPVGAVLVVANGGADLAITNSIFRQSRTGAAVALTSGNAPAFSYDDFNGNTSNFSGMPSVVGSAGNVDVNPLFVAPVRRNFALQATSPLIDAGDPAIDDRDGTRSDLGIYGGPQGW